MKRKSCTLRMGYTIHDPAVDERIKRVVVEKSPEQIERERRDAERDNDIRMLLRAGEGDNRPITTPRRP